ncbi:MAG: hypothetical protein Q9227_005629 [Pyrenula ochraceoflavens]
MRTTAIASFVAATAVASVAAQDSTVTVTVTECGTATSNPPAPPPTDTSTPVESPTSVPTYPGTGTGTGSSPAPTEELNDLAKGIGKLYFGTATDIPPVDDQGAELYDNGYMTILNDTHMFGQRTPANIMKWVFTEPEPGVFNFTGGDQFIEWAQEHDQIVRCHNLNWYNQLPDWITNGNWTNATLTAALERHITANIEHFGDNCYAWDVVNEAIADDMTNGTYRQDIWSEVIGAPAFIYLAFEFAQNAVQANGLKTKLYYNDYGIENTGAKSAATATLVSEIKARGIQIDGVGMQSHFEVGLTPSRSDQLSVMQSYLALGVDVAQTELDVRFTSLPYNYSTLQTQKDNYRDSVGACVDAGAGCVGTTLWDFDDAYSWVPSTFPGQGGADVWDEDLNRKPAYYGIIEGLTGMTVADPPGTVNGNGTVSTMRRRSSRVRH